MIGFRFLSVKAYAFYKYDRYDYEADIAAWLAIIDIGLCIYVSFPFHNYYPCIIHPLSRRLFIAGLIDTFHGSVDKIPEIKILLYLHSWMMTLWTTHSAVKVVYICNLSAQLLLLLVRFFMTTDWFSQITLYTEELLDVIFSWFKQNQLLNAKTVVLCDFYESANLICTS